MKFLAAGKRVSRNPKLLEPEMKDPSQAVPFEIMNAKLKSIGAGSAGLTKM